VISCPAETEVCPVRCLEALKSTLSAVVTGRVAKANSALINMQTFKFRFRFGFGLRFLFCFAFVLFSFLLLLFYVLGVFTVYFKFAALKLNAS